jgi:SH3-like domain-containing protein
MGGQGEARSVGVGVRRKIARALGASLSGLLIFGAAAGAAERQTPSGLPVPRYVSLKFDKVNARAGPGDDHKLMWVYRVKGLPVQVVAETSEWRRICDPEGSLVWVHRRTTDGRRTVLNVKQERVTLLRRPRPDARAAAFLNPRALAALDRCEKGWCKVHVDGVSGWAKEGDLWGTAPAPQCR